MSGAGDRLDDTERALLAAWRAAARRDPVERELLAVWRRWRAEPATRPPWGAALQQRLAADPDAPLPATGLAGPDGLLLDAPSRVLGMLLGGAVGEFTALGRVGHRTSALLFVLEGLLRAHTRARSAGDGDPLRGAVSGLRRWLRSRGVPWRDCTGTGAPNGWLLAERALRSRLTDEPTMLLALGRITGGHPAGTRAEPLNSADSATAVPLGALAALWSADPETVFALGGDLAALTHGHPDGHDPAGVVGVLAHWLLRGRPLEQAVAHGVAAWPPGRPKLARARGLGEASPAGFAPGPAELDAMALGRSGLDALAIAVRCALAAPDFATAVRAASRHGGDSASSAMLCGLLLGALHGPTAVPERWRTALPITGLVERIAEDAATEFGPYPDESDDWERRYPTSDLADPHRPAAAYRTGLAAVPRLAASRDRFVGGVLGAAIGEALGMPVAGDNWEEIRSRHGNGGITDYVPAGHPSGRLGSDTQLLLFSLEGTIRANVRRRSAGAIDPTRHLQHAYQRWLHTQHLSWPRAAGEFLADAPAPDGWLVEQRALFQTRNPGRTMMRTLIAFAKGQQSRGTPEDPVSDAEDSGAVLRTAPAALWSGDPAEVFGVGMATAALTHGHPSAYLSGGALAFLVARLVHGVELTAAVDEVLEQLTRHSGHDEVSRRLLTAMRLSKGTPLPPDELNRALGTGWTAAEALGIGVHAALVAEGDLDAGLAVAVNHSGNSATTGAVCGCLLGATTGADRIPERWIADLELHEVVERLAHDAVLEFGPRPPDWADRYPPT
ncbi:ADP-ribosylglycohydrolase family protein [Saccharopolyspora sp. CA-218241]|uniref:ADP-ribosylglycohydrolase family protein n=1 Tax=Saccharopolyspora sp. CA-218241 TaxID=3240027 RepID=UPI003D98EC87